jgi:CspA family cold shock protein
VNDLKGNIKRLIRERGFGFIVGEDGQEVFFHRSALDGDAFDALDEGNSVEFDLEAGPKGPRATNVKAASTEAESTEEESTEAESTEEESTEAESTE